MTQKTDERVGREIFTRFRLPRIRRLDRSEFPNGSEERRQRYARRVSRRVTFLSTLSSTRSERTMRRVGDATGVSEESPLVKVVEKGGGLGDALRRHDRSRTWVTRAIVLGAILGCVGVAAYASGLGGKWIIAPGGRVLGPTVDTCSSTCNEVNETSTHTFAYSDPTGCAGGGFGCRGSCRLCHIKPYPSRSWRYQQCPTCVCTFHEKSTGCDPCAAAYSYFRFQVKTIRENDPSDPYYQATGCGTGICQFSEIKLYSNGGATLMSLDSSQSTVLGGNLCAPSEGPNAATDGSLNTKMCDRDTVMTPEGLNFVFAASTPSTFSHYEFFTANDCPVRDPTSWTLYGSTVSNQGPWVELGSGSDRPPTTRKASYGKTQVCT